MKILFIAPLELDYKTAGGIHCNELIKSFRKKGYKVVPIARGGLDKFLVKIPVIRIPYIGTVFTEILHFLTLVFLLSSNNFHLIYFRIEAHAFLVHFIKKLFKIPLFVEVNGILLDEIKANNYPDKLAKLCRYTERYTYRAADRIISVTQSISDYITNNYKIPPDKIRVIHNGVNTELFVPSKTLPPSYSIGYAGSIVHWQGVDILIRAVHHIVQSGFQVLCIIIGDGAELNNIKTLVKELGIENNVIFTGHIPYEELPDKMKNFSIGIIPKRIYRSGWLPLKLFEYISMGIPVIATNIKEMHGLLTSNDIGVTVPPEDYKALGDAIIELINDKEKRERFRNNALSISKNLSWDRVTDEILNLFSEFCINS